MGGDWRDVAGVARLLVAFFGVLLGSAVVFVLLVAILNGLVGL